MRRELQSAVLFLGRVELLQSPSMTAAPSYLHAARPRSVEGLDRFSQDQGRLHLGMKFQKFQLAHSTHHRVN